MTIGANVFSLLSGNAGVTAIVGAPPNCRVYPKVIPERGQVPAVTYNVISGMPQSTFDAHAPADYERVQLTCWAMSYDGAVALRDAVRAAIEDRDAQITLGIGAQPVAFNGDTYEPDTRRHGQYIDFSFWT